MQLIDLTCGAVLATRSDYNAQITCGLNIISRINYARRPERREELPLRAINVINRLLRAACRSHGVDPREVCNAVVSGNTTMIHLLLGLNPEYIRLQPYTPTILQTPYLTAAEVGMDIGPDSWVYFSPAVGSYVGGDITAGILCTDLATDTRADQPVRRYRNQRRIGGGQSRFSDDVCLLGRPRIRRRRHRMRNAHCHRGHRKRRCRPGYRNRTLYNHRRCAAQRHLRLGHD